MRRIVLLILLPLTVHAEVSLAGVPEQVFPDMLRSWALSYANDSTVYDRDDRFRKHDDLRTATLSGYFRFHSDYIGAFDLSLLTDKHGHQRNDELSLSIGRQWSTPADRQSRLQLQGGVGLRLADDFNGEETQNSLHDITSGIDVEMPYADSDHALFLYGRAQWLKQIHERWQIDTRHALLFDTNGLLQLDLHLRQTFLLSPDSSLSVGLRWRDHFGNGLHAVAEQVLNAEDQWWLQLGGSWRRFGLQFEHHLSTSRSQLILSIAAQH